MLLKLLVQQVEDRMVAVPDHVELLAAVLVAIVYGIVVHDVLLALPSQVRGGFAMEGLSDLLRSSLGLCLLLKLLALFALFVPCV